MSEDTQKKLAKRWLVLVEAGKARWMPGMRDDDGYRYLGDGWWSKEADPANQTYHMEVSATDWPDFNDPATLGCLLAQARERLANNRVRVTPNAFNDTSWFCGAPLGEPFSGATEAEAIIAALEAAP